MKCYSASYTRDQCRRNLRRLRGALADVPIKPPRNLSQESAEPLSVTYVARVVAKLVLRDVLAEIARVNVVVRADQPALEHRPERFNILRVHLAAYVFGLVPDHLMRQHLAHVVIERIAVSHKARLRAVNAVEHLTLNALLRRLHNLGTDAAPTFLYAEHRGTLLPRLPYRIAHRLAVYAMRSMAAKLATDIRLIGLDGAGESGRVLVRHRPADAVAHKPRGFVRHAELALYLSRTHRLLGNAHALSDYQPRSERNLGVFEDGALRNRELPPTSLALVERARRDRASILSDTSLDLQTGNLEATAVIESTGDSVRPALRLKEGTGISFCSERVSQVWGVALASRFTIHTPIIEVLG